MAKYTVNTRIISNVSASKLFYDLKVYKKDGQNKELVLLSASKQPFTTDYKTQSHITNEADDDLSVIYMMDIMLYREHGGKMHQVLRVPSTKMYTLREMVSGKAFSDTKRDNICYFETKTETKPVNESGEDNIHSVQISCYERAFIAKEYPVGNPLDPFEKGKIDAQIAARINHSSYPDQGRSSLCGPAAFFYCLLKDRPDVYKQAAEELWSHGKAKISGLDIVPGNGCRHPKGSFYNGKSPRISGLDWITLASLRDSENILFNYDEIDDRVSGITMWGKLSEWFEKAGYKKIFSNISLSSSSAYDVIMLNNYFNSGHKVVTLISVGMLQGSGYNDDGSENDTSEKNHWVVWEGTLKDSNGHDITAMTNSNSIVTLNMFSWGTVGQQIRIGKPLSYVLKHIFGGLVFKPLK